MARNPELDHEFRENVPEKKPGTAGFVYIDENHSRCTTNGFNPLEGPQMASLTTLGDSQRKGWKRILIYTLAGSYSGCGVCDSPSDRIRLYCDLMDSRT